MRKRSILINGRKTSVSLEDEFFEYLKAHAAEREMSFCRLIEEIQAGIKKGANLSSALRVYALETSTRKQPTSA